MDKKKKMGKRQLQYLQILEKNGGLIQPSCQASGVSRASHYKWINDFEGFAEKVEEIKESMKDFAEGKLLQAITNDDLTACIFYLKCQAKDRGYIDKQLIEHSGSSQVVVITGENEIPD